MHTVNTQVDDVNTTEQHSQCETNTSQQDSQCDINTIEPYL